MPFFLGKEKKLLWFFLTGLVCKYVSLRVSLDLPLFFFSPLMALGSRRIQSEKHFFTLACALGFFVEFFSSDFRFGIQTLSYVVSACILYRLHRCFVDSLLGFCLLIMTFSLALSSVMVLLTALFHPCIRFHWYEVLTNLLIFPLFDSLYGAFFFSIFPNLLQKIGKKWGYFLFFLKKTKHRNRERKPVGLFRYKKRLERDF